MFIVYSATFVRKQLVVVRILKSNSLISFCKCNICDCK